MIDSSHQGKFTRVKLVFFPHYFESGNKYSEQVLHCEDKSSETSLRSFDEIAYFCFRSIAYRLHFYD